MENLNSILVITYYFFPDQEVGAKRFSFLTSYWSKNISKIHVLTRKNNSKSYQDKSLPYGGIIHRVPILPLHSIKNKNILYKILSYFWINYFCVIDPYSDWIIPGYIMALKIIKKNKIDLIVATGPPFSSLVIGYILKIFTKKCLIIDYRDPWSNHRRMHQKGYIKNLNKILEQKVCSAANAKIFVTNMMKENFKKDFVNKFDENIYVVNNGYLKNKKQKKKFFNTKLTNMVYAGVLYGARNIELFVKPFNTLLKEGIISNENFKFHVFSPLNENDRQTIIKNGLENIITIHPIVSHKEIISYLSSADILVLIISKEMKYSVSYKFYDYLAVKKPIFAIVPKDSEMQKIIRQIGCGCCAFIDDEKSIQITLENMLKGNIKYTWNSIEKYKWKKISEKYFKILKNIVKLNQQTGNGKNLSL